MTPPADAAARARRQRLAWFVALAADALQLALLPLFAPGALSIADDVLDVIVSVALLRLLGWHPALLPALAVELIPGADLVPTWTAAVALIAWTRRREPAPAPASSEATVVPDEPPPPRTLPPAS